MKIRLGGPNVEDSTIKRFSRFSRWQNTNS